MTKFTKKSFPIPAFLNSAPACEPSPPALLKNQVSAEQETVVTKARLQVEQTLVCVLCQTLPNIIKNSYETTVVDGAPAQWAPQSR